MRFQYDHSTVRPACALPFILRAFLKRQRSGWTNSKLCALIVARLAATLKPHASDYKFVLLFDASRAHLAMPVMDAWSRTGILLIVIPAGCTDLLQPLDTHVFSALKSRLRELHGQPRRHSNPSECMPQFVQCIRGAIDEILCARDWSHAFSGNGFELGQKGVSDSLASLAALRGCGSICSDAVSLAQVEACVPERAQTAAAIIWRRFIEDRPCTPSSVRERMLPPREIRPELGRTRSQTRALSKGM